MTSKTSYFTKVDGKKVTSAENIVKRHGGRGCRSDRATDERPIGVVCVGVLGLCAIVLSSPYEIPVHVPEALMLLCEHSHDPDLIQVRDVEWERRIRLMVEVDCECL